MQALSGLTEAVLPKKQPMTFGEKIHHYIKEFFEELIIYVLKFKAWLTPGTADDQVRPLSSNLQTVVDRFELWDQVIHWYTGQLRFN